MLTKQDIKVFEIASKDGARPALQTVQLKRVQRDGRWYIRLAATDSYRLVERLVAVQDRPSFSEIVYQAWRFKDISKLMGKDDVLEIKRHKWTVKMPSGAVKTEYPVTPVEYDFPKYEKIIHPKVTKATVILDPKLLKTLCEQAEGGVEFVIGDPLDPVVGKCNSGRSEIKLILMPQRR